MTKSYIRSAFVEGDLEVKGHLKDQIGPKMSQKNEESSLFLKVLFQRYNAIQTNNKYNNKNTSMILSLFVFFS